MKDEKEHLNNALGKAKVLARTGHLGKGDVKTLTARSNDRGKQLEAKVSDLKAKQAGYARALEAQTKADEEARRLCELLANQDEARGGKEDGGTATVDATKKNDTETLSSGLR